MSNPQSQKEIIEQIVHIQQGVSNDVKRLSDKQFINGTTESWSVANYLKHLLLSVKPVAKALSLPADRLQAQFGLAKHPSRTYTELVKAYQKRLDEGMKAEDYERVTPTFYRFPEGTVNARDFLMQSWDEANQRLINATNGWTETELDTLQMPHPAIGMVTLREMLFFTVYHNALHWRDIQAAGGL